MIVQAPMELAVYTAGQDSRLAMAQDVREALLRSPREIPCRYFYDERGSRLFDEITLLPEYYPTRAETEILEANAGDIVRLTRPESIVELGAGSCTKSQLLIAAGRAAGSLRHFVPFDISAAAIHEAAWRLVADFSGLHVYGVIGELETHLVQVPRLGRQLVLFLGSTIGNLDDGERVAFLRRVRAMMDEEDWFLLGIDLVKAERELHDAYNDGRGLTAAFNLNVLEVVNRQLGADFDVAAYAHQAGYVAARRRIEMHLRSLRRQRVRVPAAELEVVIERNELIRTEISVKFTRETVERDLRAAGLRLHGWLTDAGSRFALALAR